MNYKTVNVDGVDVPFMCDHAGTCWVKLRDGLHFFFKEGDKWYVSRDEAKVESIQFCVEMLPTA